MWLGEGHATGAGRGLGRHRPQVAVGGGRGHLRHLGLGEEQVLDVLHAAHPGLQLLRPLLRGLLLLLRDTVLNIHRGCSAILLHQIEVRKRPIICHPRPLTCMSLISLLMASSCSCSMQARVWASVWPPGESSSVSTDSLSSAVSASMPALS